MGLPLYDSLSSIAVNLPSPQSPQRFSPFGWVIIFCVVALLITAAAMSFRKSERHVASMGDPIARVPEFSFTTQEGKTLTKSDLLGKIWVADFIFTRCSGPCPIMTSRMLELSSKLTKNHDVKLISVSVDPTNDTPEVLAAYASNVHADPTQWFFLTGPLQDITSFTQQGMKQALVFEPGGAPNHSTRLMLVDKEGMIRSNHDGSDPEVVQKILTDIGSLLREAQATHKNPKSTQ